jgi:hypothetical protein
LALWAGLGVVAVVDAVVVAEVVVVAADAGVLVLSVELEDADPHALTSSISRTAASGMRTCFMMPSRTPGAASCFPVDWRRRRGC